MRYGETAKRLAEYRKQIAALRQEMRALQEKIGPEKVKDYTFESAACGTVRLAELFGDHDTLFVVHNMGRNCPNCTLWADGFNGVFDHLSSRAAFVVSSPDPPEEQQRFAKSRGSRRFPMVSHRGLCARHGILRRRSASGRLCVQAEGRQDFPGRRHVILAGR